MASSFRARTLHRVTDMKRTVGILAATLFLGCGVGVDDVEGQLAAYGQVQSVQALGEGQPPPTPAERPGDVEFRHGTQANAESTFGSVAGAASSTASASSTAPGDTVNSPVDPIPAFDPRLTLPTAGPFPGL